MLLSILYMLFPDLMYFDRTLAWRLFWFQLEIVYFIVG